MTTLFKDSALAYAEVLKYLRSQKPGDAKTIDQIWRDLSHISFMRNTQQVIDAIKSYYAKGWLGRMREGRAFVYWAKSSVPESKTGDAKTIGQIWAMIDRAELPPAPAPAPTSTSTNKPEIIVTDNSIVINHAKCKITIEF